MPLLRPRPRGGHIKDVASLKEGARVEGYLTSSYYAKGHIVWSPGHSFPDLYLKTRTGKHNLYYKIGTRVTYPFPNAKLYFMPSPILKLMKGNSMSNKLLSVLHLNKDQRKLSKAGVYDSNGNLTQDGQELVLNLLAKEYEEKIVDLCEPLLKKKKDCEEED